MPDPTATPAAPVAPPAGPAEPVPSGPGVVLGALACALAVALLGVPVGLLWSALSPRADLVRTGDGIDYADSETKDFITADAYLFLLCLAAGVLAALLVWWLARRRGPATLLGLVVGAAAAAYVAAKVGVHGSTRSQVLAAGRAGRLGARFDLPLQLHARTVLLALPGGAALTWAALVLRTPAPLRATAADQPRQDPGALSSG